MYDAIIVEDSRLARLELRSQLEQIPSIQLIGEASTLEEATTLLNENKVDLIFLDIDLPDGNGFDLLAQQVPAPKVIFTTAFAEFAIQAFEKQAVDYLLKPFTIKRLKEACARLPEQTNLSNKAVLKSDERFFVKDGQQCWLIELSQVERFSSNGNYTHVHFEGKKPLLYRTLSQIEKRLDPKTFFRANRGEIVQIARIANTELCASGALVLTLYSGDQVKVSRRQLSKFKQIFSM